jgi:hypothetical protein
MYIFKKTQLYTDNGKSRKLANLADDLTGKDSFLTIKKTVKH